MNAIVLVGPLLDLMGKSNWYDEIFYAPPPSPPPMYLNVDSKKASAPLSHLNLILASRGTSKIMIFWPNAIRGEGGEIAMWLVDSKSYFLG